MTAAVRKTFGLLAGILIYYLVHEGAHLVLAMAFGVFQEVRFLELGVQIAITSREALSDLQFAAFNAAGAGASLAIAYLLVLSAGRINRLKGKVVKAVGYYTTILLLLNDPFYLSVLCGFVGGGDMNGIVMFGISETAARVAFGALGLVNLGIVWKYVLPAYRAGFAGAETDDGKRGFERKSNGRLV